MRLSRSAVFALLLAFGFVISGCSGSNATPASKTAFSAVVSLHTMMVVTTGRPPKSEEAFKEFIAANGSAAMERAGVASVDELLVSNRDGKPYVIIYGKPPAGVAHDVIVFEQEGIDGKRLVGRNTGFIAELDESQFRELVPASTQIN